MFLWLNFILITNSYADSNNLKPEVFKNNPIVIASINPIYQIVLAITADKDNTILLINHTLSEHNYQLKISDIKNIKNADLVFYISNNLESFMPKFNLKQTNKLFELIKIKDLKLLKEKNSNDTDVHIWLNPQNAIIIAKFITQKLAEIAPQNSKIYQNNLKKFIQEVDLANPKITKKISAIKNLNYMVYHNGYQYFEDYFKIKPIKTITDYEGQELTIKDLQEIKKLIKTKQVKCLFGEPEEEKNSAFNLAKSSNINFAILNLIGNKEDYGSYSKGYSNILINITDDMYSCLMLTN